MRWGRVDRLIIFKPLSTSASASREQRQNHSTHTRQPQLQATQQQIDTYFVELIPCASSKPRHKALLAVERPQVTRVERIGPVLFVQPVTARTSDGADF